MSEPLSPSPLRRVERLRFEPRRRQAVVAAVERLGAGFSRLTLQGDDLADLPSPGFDDHLKLLLPDGAGGLLMRDMTPRRIDHARRTLVLEVARHGHGPASTWAAQVRPGQAVTVAGPRGSMVVPADLGWHLLAGDASALPAIRRRLEELPAGAQAIVLALLPDAADDVVLDVASAATVSRRVLRDAPGLLAALDALVLPAGEGFAWFGGEAALAREVRARLAGTHRLPKQAMRVAAYWKAGASAFHERLDD